MKPELKIVGGVEADLPEPPFANDLKSDGWRFELDCQRIELSDTWALAKPELRPWLLMLWFKAWQQAPIGSYPNNDEIIAAKIGMEPEIFQAYRPVLMRGWILYRDNRFYHPVIMEFVESMLHKSRIGKRKQKAYRDRKAAEKAEQAKNDDDRYRNVTVTLPSRHGNVTTERREERVEIKDIKGHTSESVDSDQSTPPAEDKKKSPPCPYQKILEIYHEVLPELPGVPVLTDTRERTIRSLWLHKPDLDWWRDYFQDVRRSDFLMGRSKPGAGRTKPFMADLEWLVKPGNFAKVYEGRYHS
jgi:hypothetical protein